MKLFKNLTSRFWALIALCALVRLIFIFYGSSIYYGEPLPHKTSDTFSFINAADNLLESGRLSYDPANPQAATGRLPGYPAYVALHRLVLPDAYFPRGIAISQMLLELLAIVALFQMMLHLFNEKSAWLGALIYAFNPFTIVWIVIVGTESIATSMMVIALFWVSTSQLSWRNAIVAGLLVALLFYLRSYLAISLFALACLYFARSQSVQLSIKLTALSTIAFLVAYSAWPIRNLVVHQQMVWVKSDGSGYPTLRGGFRAYGKWTKSWSHNAIEYLDQLLAKDGSMPQFPDRVFSSSEERALAHKGVRLLRACDNSTQLWLHHRPLPDSVVSCSTETTKIFKQLRESYIRNHPFDYWIRVPSQFLPKVFFKSEIRSNKGETGFKTMLTRMLFAYRSVLVILGVLGVLVLGWRKPALLAFGGTALIQCLIVIVIVRQLEMRYIHQADLLLTVPAAVFFATLWQHLTRIRDYSTQLSN